MRISVKLAAILALSFSPFFSGCVAIRDSPAPACVKYIGPAPMGGCAGKHAIIDLEVDAPDCLRISANNCNGGVLEIQNTCADAFLLGGNEISSGELASLDIRDEGDGNYGLVRNYSNFSDFLPASDIPVRASGVLRGKEIQLTFIKTGPLCE